VNSLIFRIKNEFTVFKKVFPFLSIACFLLISAYPFVRAVQPVSGNTVTNAPPATGTDSLTSRFPVKAVAQDGSTDPDARYPMDLKDPDNIKSTIVYDPATGNYFFYTKVGTMDIISPTSLNGEEYQNYSMQKSMREYWRQRNDSVQKSPDAKYKATDMKFSLGPADKLFGPGGVQVKMTGSAELGFGLRTNSIKNPTYSTRMQNPAPAFDFNEKIQLNVNGKVGDKVNFNINYNTESSFDFDQKMLKLAYDGKDDEIIRKIEAGNVSLPLSSSLITGSSALFGIKTELQFGKLNVVAVASQQQSQTKTVSSKGGVQTTKFNFSIDKYDSNRHFFLSQFFRNNFDRWMEQLPYITSGINISKIEVWVTNKRASFNQARNIVAFSDLGEPANLANSHWLPTINSFPSNGSNKLYNEVTGLPGIRDIQNSNAILETQYAALGIVGSRDYEKLESARKLDSTEYKLNKTLGYISLNTSLNSDEVLAVAYQYTYMGQTYQVGEFSTDPITAPKAIMVKLIKNTNLSPGIPLWQLMMKNIYSLGATQIQKEKFKLDVLYENDSTGINVAFIKQGNIANKRLIQVLNLDNLDSKNEAHPDGIFDYVEGYTAVSSGGRIIFPEVEPFGSFLAKKIGNPATAQKYIYQELYDSTLTVAQQYSQKNKFRLSGEYKGTSSSQIQLNASNIPRGSVVVTAGGRTLTENQDYIVDYVMGTVTVLNQSLLSSGTSIDVKLENQSMFDLQRKTLLGTHLEYAFSKNFSVGATLMHLSEMPLTQKVSYGSDPISNTIWGLNTSFRTESQWLTNLVDKLPFLNLTKPSTLNLNAEFAQLIPGHPNSIEKQGVVYIDDFEGAKTDLDISYPYSWFLASTPYDASAGALFPEAALNNNINYGKNRALFNWFTIDQSVFSSNSSLTPDYIRNNKDLQSNNLTRQILEQEIFPNRESTYGTTSYLPVLNISFYPNQRGPYNLDVIPGQYSKGIDSNGNLASPETRWGGMMRRLDNSDFESSNIEYIDFWMMDPFVNDTLKHNTGGDLYFNLGDISEDILKDGKKFFENGLSVNGDTTNTTATVWGRVPDLQSTVLAFDNDANARKYQDVGLDGLTTDGEKAFPTYKNYLDQLKTMLSPAALKKWQDDPFSPLNDPAGDNYMYYRNSTWDQEKAPILERYKRYNGVEGNSTSDNSNSNYSSAATTIPDAEDINQDNTLNQYENYYQYKISLRRNDLVVGTNYLIDKIYSTTPLKNGKPANVNWYHFKIPIRQYQKRVGTISDFKSIRFMRMFMSDFSDSTFLRFGTMNLVRGEWRNYTQSLYDPAKPPASAGTLSVSAVNIEEDGKRIPVNYVLPPGVSRQIDPSQPQVRQENEQSLALTVTGLAPGDARAVYKNTTYDMRKYKKIELFTHAEKLADDITNLQDNDLSVFVRVGSDFTNNYYEYEVPLKLTAGGNYLQSSDKDRAIVWPSDNAFDVNLSALTKLKLQRNAAGVPITTSYWSYDQSYPKNKMTIIGNPSLADVQSIMIGIRNKSSVLKSGEIWVDELRLTNFNEDGGWAGVANASVVLSDFGNINAAGKIIKAGFGGIEQNISERSMDDDYQFNFSSTFQMGKFFPEKARVNLPVFFSYSKELIQPKYNPLDQDILLSDALKTAISNAARDSIKSLSQTWHTTKSFNITNARVDIRSKAPQLYDPANFSFSYIYNETNDKSPDVIYSYSKDYRGTFSYTYSNQPKSWEPFKKIKGMDSPILKLIGDFNINLIPTLLGFNANLSRTYSQSQLRDFSTIQAGQAQTKDDMLSFSKDFLLDRRIDIKYDFTKSLSVSFASTINSRIDEPYVPVDKTLFPDEYKVWKDSIKKSLANLGRPLAYQQLFSVRYTLPINKLPYMDFITPTAQYTSNYNWQTGVTTASKLNAGNYISNTTQSQIDASFNFEVLYNKIKFLSDVNKKFATNQRQAPFRSRKFTQVVILEKGKPTRVVHRLNTKKIVLQAADSIGKPLTLQYKIADDNIIEISPLAKAQKVSITINTLNPNDVSISRKVIEYAARTLMFIRRGTISYRYSQSLSLPGFKGTTNWLGQSDVLGSTAPGYGFSFGFFGSDFVKKAYDKGWLVSNDSVTSPAVYAVSKDFTAQFSLEPIRSLKIEVGDKWSRQDQKQIQYMFDGMPTTYTGNFNMSTIAIRTTFRSTGNAANGFSSATFRNFMNNRTQIAQMLENSYAGQRYPNTGIWANSAFAGQKYDPANGGVNANSADVIVPAFLAAYTGRSVSGNRLGLFPSLLQALPNWSVSFDGLSQLPIVTKYLKSVTLTHTYTCNYSINAYSSFASWGSNTQGFGFVKDVTTGNPVPSSQYDIASVSLNESFNPLIGVDAVMKNNLSGRIKYNRSRNVTLNITSSQIIEALTNEWVVGMGYMIKDFNLILKVKNKSSKVKNDLTIRGDFSMRDTRGLLRRFDTDAAQATDGAKLTSLKLSAEYVFSSTLNIKAYYDRTMSNPLISLSYPTSNSDFGVSFRFMLTR
jgi:cell surface protein SprA